MERKLLSMLALVFTLAVSAQAQVRLIIDSPASIAGSITPIGLPANDGSWGFDRDTTGPVTAPVQCLLGIDSFACSALTPGSLTGKIALIHRGPDPALGLGQPCGFGIKALNCQNAGAVGVLMVYEPRGTQGQTDLPAEISGSNGADLSGGDVTIPIVVVDRPTGRRIKPLLCNGGVVTLGGFLGYDAFNLSFDKTTEATAPKAAAFPQTLLTDTGDYAFTPTLTIHNVGNQNQSNVMAHAIVHRYYNPNSPGAAPYDVYHDSVSIPSITKFDDTSANSVEVVFSRFDIWNAVQIGGREGIYELEYRVMSPNGDADFADNVMKYRFRITDHYHSYGQLDANTDELPTFQQVSPVLASASNRNYKLGSIFNTPVNMPIRTVVDSVRLGVAVGTDSVDLSTVQITLDLSQWDDADGDGAISDAELTSVGTGLMTFGSNADNGKYFTVPIDDAVTGNPGPVELQAGKTYVMLAGYQGDDIAAFSGVTDAEYSYFKLFTQIPGLLSPFFLDGAWRVGFRNAWAAYRIGILNPTSTRPGLSQVAVTLQPNPARDYVEVTLAKDAGATTLQVLDMSGRVLKSVTSSGAAPVRIATGELSNGLYQMVVRTRAGMTVRKFAVSK